MNGTFEGMFDQLMPLMWNSIIPIGMYDRGGGNPEPVGTGTLFAIAERAFIVSAAHVIEVVDDHSGMACAFVSGERGEHGTRLTPVPIIGTAYRANDPPDVGVMALSPETAAALSGCRFLRMSDVGLQAESLGCGWVCGFPHEYIRAIPAGARRLEPLTLASTIRPHDGSGLLNYDPLYHFLLNADRASFGWSDGSGPVTLPDRFQGISGCAVWQTWWPSRGELDNPRAHGAKVVGVQIGYYRNQSLIKATHWGCVAEVMRQAFPELRPLLGMHFGDVFAS